ncbi:MAG: glycosyltransferase family 2 protein [Rhodospirillales bacterium]|nr:glycosyltransferase family 2 protein [Alphaproteobacteria bacterium]MCB9986527.1 glycosyltransferase family 2 protein [Rhodospirillales bacterium]USO06936.1 MAG: glycosyltransferase family 2 protein [Rhodospirillales bacterium]
MLSVVVPVYNEAENIAPLIAEIAALKGRVPLAEIVYVNDGSTDGTLAELLRLKAQYPMLRVITQSPRAGQSCATWSGVLAATQPVCVTLDGDGQNDPEGIVGMFATFMTASQAGTRVMVAGQRQKREDNLVRILSSRIANNVRSALLKDGVRDTGCALKMFRREDYLSLPYFNHMHRFLAALMIREGVNVALSPVRHRPRTRGVSKYGVMNRLFVGIVDLFGVRWLQARARPAKLTLTEGQ